MLSRGSSDAGTRLRRSKSTSSTVHSHRAHRPEPLDLDVAQQHALAAATTAFVRAHGESAAVRTSTRSTELSRTELSRAKSNASRKSEGSHFLQREPSLRSLPHQKAAKVPGLPRQPRPSTVATERFPPFNHTPSTGNTMSSQPSAQSNENVRPSSQPKSQRLSASSSVASQQIRKARSMYYASSVQTGSPIARPPAKYLTTPPPISPVPDASLLSAGGYQHRPRSAAVSPLVPPRLPVTVAPTDTVDQARDKYLQNFQQQRQVRPKPSLFLAPFMKRQDKAKKKAPASSSGRLSTGTHTPVDPGSDVHGSEFKPLKEKRSISDSLRNKFRKVFRRSSNKTTTLPVQQIDAGREYFHHHQPPPQPPELHAHFDVPSPDEHTLQRVRSRSPSFEGGRAAYARPSSRDSNRSLHSETSISAVTTSRVTSWNSTSAGDTLTQRAIKRLTVIHEAKDSIGSEAEPQASPISPKRKAPPIPGFAAFRDPMPMDNFVTETATPVDPKRVFSALMKEIDSSKAAHAVAPMQQTSDGDSDVFVSTTTRELHSSASREHHLSAGRELHSSGGRELRSSGSRDLRGSASSDGRLSVSYRRPESASARSKSGSVKTNSLRSLGRALKATIRTVTPSQQLRPPSPPVDRTTSVRGAVRIPRPNTEDSPDTVESEPDGKSGGGNNTLRSINFKLRPRGHARETLQPEKFVTPTREQIDSRLQGSEDRWMTPLEEKPKSWNRVLEGTTSTGPDTPLAQLDRPRTAGRGIPKSPRPRQVFSPLSPSVYSRNTDGVSILPNDSVMSLGHGAEHGSRQGSVSGSAIILTSNRSVKSYRIGTPSPNRVADSTHSSRDWKAWLSHEVSELGNLADGEISIRDEYSSSTPTAPRHQREYTQISEESTDTTVLIHDLESPPVPDMHTPVETTPPNGRGITLAAQSASPTGSQLSFILPPVFAGSPDSLLKSPTAPKPMRLPSSMSKETSTSSVPSVGTSLSRPLFEHKHSPSDRMNERFPFIAKGRRDSSNSPRVSMLSRHTPSLAGSGSSGGKATPSPKLYSDFSLPESTGGNLSTSKDERATNNENTPPTTMRTMGVPLPGSATSPSLDRPRSLQPLANANNSNWNRTTSSLAQYTTSVDEVGKQGASGSPGTGSQAYPQLKRDRIRLRIRPMDLGKGKLTTRPKSAFDLRTMNAMNEGSGDGTGMNMEMLRTPNRSPVRRTEHDALISMQLQARRNAASPMARETPSPLSSRVPKLALHIKHSSSTLALNKEPSPGTETRIIDSVVLNEVAMAGTAPEYGLPVGSIAAPSRAGSVTPGIGVAVPMEAMAMSSGSLAVAPVAPPRGGSVTPGHRMAERFLQERNWGSGAGAGMGTPRDVSGATTTGSPMFV